MHASRAPVRLPSRRAATGCPAPCAGRCPYARAAWAVRRGSRNDTEFLQQHPPYRRQLVDVVEQLHALDLRRQLVERNDHASHALTSAQRHTGHGERLHVRQIAQPRRCVGRKPAVPTELVQRRAPVQQRTADVDRIERERRVKETRRGIGFRQARAIRHQRIGGRRDHRRQTELHLEQIEQSERAAGDFADAGPGLQRLQSVEVHAEMDQHRRLRSPKRRVWSR